MFVEADWTENRYKSVEITATIILSLPRLPRYGRKDQQNIAKCWCTPKRGESLETEMLGLTIWRLTYLSPGVYYFYSSKYMAMRSLVLEYSNSSGALNSAAAESQLEQDSYVKGILKISS